MTDGGALERARFGLIRDPDGKGWVFSLRLDYHGRIPGTQVAELERVLASARRHNKGDTATQPGTVHIEVPVADFAAGGALLVSTAERIRTAFQGEVG